MHKFMLKLFGFLKSTAQFLKIVVLFCVLCLLLYWIQNLAGFNWSWLNFIKPLLESFLEAGKSISDDVVYLFDAVFEHKYGIALILFFVLYYITHLIQIGFQALENFYGDTRRFIKKCQEDAYNRALDNENTKEQEQIKNYQIYVAAYPKKKNSHLEANVNLEEEIKAMNKFLIKETGISPAKYGEGFLYVFNDFSHIDNVLPHFFRLINSQAPLDYIICVQILPKNIKKEYDNMKKLINLNLYNKITTLADTVWRYKFNQTQKFETNQLGLYQKDKDSFEAHEFTEF